MSRDAFRCDSCRKTVATRRKGIIVPKSPARSVRIEAGRVLILCGCGGKRWIALAP